MVGVYPLFQWFVYQAGTLKGYETKHPPTSLFYLNVLSSRFFYSLVFFWSVLAHQSCVQRFFLLFFFLGGLMGFL